MRLALPFLLYGAIIASMVAAAPVPLPQEYYQEKVSPAHRSPYPFPHRVFSLHNSRCHRLHPLTLHSLQLNAEELASFIRNALASAQLFGNVNSAREVLRQINDPKLFARPWHVATVKSLRAGVNGALFGVALIALHNALLGGKLSYHTVQLMSDDVAKVLESMGKEGLAAEGSDGVQPELTSGGSAEVDDAVLD